MKKKAKETNKKSETLRARVYPHEMVTIRELAEKSGMSLSDWFRSLIQREKDKQEKN